MPQSRPWCGGVGLVFRGGGLVGGTVGAHSSNWRGGEGGCEQWMGSRKKRQRGYRIDTVSASTLLSRLQRKTRSVRAVAGTELRPDSKVQHSCASPPTRLSLASKLRPSSKLQIFALVSSLLQQRQHYKTLLNGRLDISITSLFSRCA
jgi:hypothetical protein